jgi:hypothetical protein
MIFHGFKTIRNEIYSFHILLPVKHDFNLIYEEINGLEAQAAKTATGTHRIGIPSVSQSIIQIISWDSNL